MTPNQCSDIHAKLINEIEKKIRRNKSFHSVTTHASKKPNTHIRTFTHMHSHTYTPSTYAQSHIRTVTQTHTHTYTNAHTSAHAHVEDDISEKAVSFLFIIYLKKA